jgi:predicted CoA-binding protein
MNTLDEAVRDFLGQKRIAIVGVSRNGDVPANYIYKRMREVGYDVLAVNPHTDSIEGDRCYRSLSEIPGVIDGVVIATPPAATLAIVHECSELGIKRVWMHRSFGQGSVDNEASRVGAELGISIIAGACPMMYVDPVDIAHKCMRWILKLTGGLPRPDNYRIPESDAHVAAADTALVQCEIPMRKSDATLVG